MSPVKSDGVKKPPMYLRRGGGGGRGRRRDARVEWRGIALGCAENCARVGVERRVDLAHLRGGYRVALEAALGVQLGHILGVLVVLLAHVEVEDPAVLGVEVEVVVLGVLEQQLARLDREADRLDRIRLVHRDLRDEFGTPRVLVPRRPRVHQQRRVRLEHPLDALEHRAPRVPHLGIRRRQLAAVGERRLHRLHPVAVIHRHVEAARHECARRRHARDARSNHRDRRLVAGADNLAHTAG